MTMKTNKLPFIRWYASDFLTGVRGFKAFEIGIYTILINEMYERCAPLPLNLNKLAWQCGCTKPIFKKTLKMLEDEGKIIITDEGLWNERVEKEFIYRQDKISVATSNINARWEKANKNKATPIQTNEVGNTTVILSQKPETRNHNRLIIRGNSFLEKCLEAAEIDLMRNPNQKIIKQCEECSEQWKSLGADFEKHIEPTIREIINKRASDKQSIPVTLKYYDNAVRAKYKKAAPNGDTDQAWIKYKTDERTKWESRVKCWVKSPKLWREDLWQSPPDHPETFVPKDILNEFGINEKLLTD